jgi:uncharacterized Zn-finger protein
MKHPLVCAALAVWMSACDGAATSPMVPAAPVPAAPAPAPAPRVPHTLSGVVFEVAPEGRVPVQNVEIYCDGCGSEVGHTRAFTDVEGFYRFEWTYDGINRLLVSKAGYLVVNPTATDGALQFKDATVSGDTRFDIEIARR